MELWGKNNYCAANCVCVSVCVSDCLVAFMPTEIKTKTEKGYTWCVLGPLWASGGLSHPTSILFFLSLTHFKWNSLIWSHRKNKIRLCSLHSVFWLPVFLWIWKLTVVLLLLLFLHCIFYTERVFFIIGLTLNTAWPLMHLVHRLTFLSAYSKCVGSEMVMQVA